MEHALNEDHTGTASLSSRLMTALARQPSGPCEVLRVQVMNSTSLAKPYPRKTRTELCTVYVVYVVYVRCIFPIPKLTFRQFANISCGGFVALGKLPYMLRVVLASGCLQD